jgi:hypothetical protein
MLLLRAYLKYQLADIEIYGVTIIKGVLYGNIVYYRKNN